VIQGTCGVIQGTCGVVQGTCGVIQGTIREHSGNIQQPRPCGGAARASGRCTETAGNIRRDSENFST
jgi:hypothetical protein